MAEPVVFGRPRQVSHPGRPHRYEDVWEPSVMGFPPLLVSRCPCGAVRDEAAVKRGRNNRARGNAFEREVAHKLGVSRVGQYGGPEDVGNAGEWIMVQTKVGNSTYPTRIDALLRRIPFRANQLRAVVHGDAPGSAGKRRALITLDLDEFCAWFGGRGDSVELG